MHYARLPLSKVQVSKYEGLDARLKRAVFERDNHRCRWCGRQRHWLGFDAHHIEYRRSSAADRLENLITLCRECHNYVHDSYKIPKESAQEILSELATKPAVTGLALLRRKQGSARPSVTGDSQDSVGRLL